MTWILWQVMGKHKKQSFNILHFPVFHGDITGPISWDPPGQSTLFFLLLLYLVYLSLFIDVGAIIPFNSRLSYAVNSTVSPRTIAKITLPGQYWISRHQFLLARWQTSQFGPKWWCKASPKVCHRAMNFGNGRDQWRLLMFCPLSLSFVSSREIWILTF